MNTPVNQWQGAKNLIATSFSHPEQRKITPWPWPCRTWLPTAVVHHITNCGIACHANNDCVDPRSSDSRMFNVQEKLLGHSSGAIRCPIFSSPWRPEPPPTALGAMNSSFTEEDDSGMPFQPRVLVWTTLQSMLRPPEVDEVRRVLGSAVIDKNEVRFLVNITVFNVAMRAEASLSLLCCAVQDLQTEVLALADILVDFRQQNAALRVSPVMVSCLHALSVYCGV